jgi:hypothetical protein
MTSWGWHPILDLGRRKHIHSLALLIRCMSQLATGMLIIIPLRLKTMLSPQSSGSTPSGIAPTLGLLYDSCCAWEWLKGVGLGVRIGAD